MFQYDFIIRSWIAGIIIAVIAPLIGIFLVSRRYSQIADTLSHVSLLGIVIGIVSGILPTLSALIVCIVSAFGIEYVRNKSKLSADSILTLFLSGSLGLALILISLFRQTSTSFMKYLFGSIATVTNLDIVIIIITALILIAIVSMNYRKLFLLSLSEDLAHASGYSVYRLSLLLTISSAMVVTLSINIVGALLIGALIVIPIITAFQSKTSFKDTLIIGLICSLVSVIGGLTLSYYLDIATGGTIVLISIFIFLISFVIKTSNK